MFPCRSVHCAAVLLQQVHERKMNANRNSLISAAIATLLVACGGGGGGGGSGGSGASGTISPPPRSTAPLPGSTAPPTAQVPPPPNVDPNPPVLEPPPVVAPPALPTPTQTPVSTPPTSLQLPPGVDMSNPGVAVKPQAVSSSSSMGGNTAAKAVDGDSTTRWESAYDDAEWIQFDFNTKTQIGSMKLVWENSHAQEYAIQVSDDAQTWYQLRYVVGSQGGTEQFMNLNSHVRYIRINCVKRSTEYGS